MAVTFLFGGGGNGDPKNGLLSGEPEIAGLSVIVGNMSLFRQRFQLGQKCALFGVIALDGAGGKFPPISVDVCRSADGRL